MTHGRGIRWRVPLVLAAGLGALAACGDASGESTAPPPAVTPDHLFRVAGHPDSMLLAITSAAVRQQADSLVSSGAIRWVVGKSVQGDGGFNTGWSWHLDPATIGFAEITIEACQTWPSAIEQNLSYWLTFGTVCVSGTVAPLPPGP